ncbi:MAG: stage 0 sporulation family protein [Clostridia bacterium]|nr:stage 0 sporulation family protein [Clostridia bacterium]
MPNIIGVQFKEVGKVYYFSPLDVVFSVGEGVIVETTHGVEYGKVVIANRDVDQSEIVGQLKTIVRKATPDDTRLHNDNLARRKQAIKLCEEKIAKRNLDMKIVDCDYTFDNSKIVFYFTAEGRVDFRELVKDLASVFKIRIDLRQIGIRDECKLLGGLGPCGRACCCNSYMGDFERVSIKMAKNQGLSLNPTKISGLCGRLMCCLKFENEHYVETLKVMPKVNSEVETPDGKGLVVAVDLLKRTVNVKVATEGDEVEIKTYTLQQLNVNQCDVNCPCAEEEEDVLED